MVLSLRFKFVRDNVLWSRAARQIELGWVCRPLTEPKVSSLDMPLLLQMLNFFPLYPDANAVVCRLLRESFLIIAPF